MSYLQLSNSQRQKIEGAEKGKMGGQCFIGTEFQFVKRKGSGDGSWRQLHDNTNVPNATELYT